MVEAKKNIQLHFGSKNADFHAIDNYEGKEIIFYFDGHLSGIKIKDQSYGNCDGSEAARHLFAEGAPVSFNLQSLQSFADGEFNLISQFSAQMGTQPIQVGGLADQFCQLQCNLNVVLKGIYAGASVNGLLFDVV